jgi:dipeptidase E
MIIASTSTLHNSGYLEYLLPELSIHFKTASSFIPYARPSGITHDDTLKSSIAFPK